MTLDIDELERHAQDAASHGEVELYRSITPQSVLALIERVRLAENVGSEWMALQEAAGFPNDGMTRGVKDVSDAVVLMAERVKELERYKAAALKTMDALTREYEALESAAKAAGVKDA